MVCLMCRSVWDDYEADTELIGRGAFARVFRAIKRDDGSHVAIKVIGRETKAFPQQRRGEHWWGSRDLTVLKPAHSFH